MSAAVVNPPTDWQRASVSRASDWRSGWSALVISAVARALLATLASLMLWSVAPAAIGWHTTVVMSASMAPQLRPGDVVASRPVAANELRLGQVVLADDPDHVGHLRMHRLVAIRPDGRLTLRGDANSSADSTPISRDAVKGVGALRSPWVGLPAYLLRTGQGLLLIPILAGLLMVLIAAFTFRLNDDDDSRDTRPRARDQHRSHIRSLRRLTPATTRPGYAARHCAPLDVRRRPGRLILVGLSVCAVAAGSALPARASSAFTAKAVNASDTWAAANYFSCGAAIKAGNPYLFYPLGELKGDTVKDASGSGLDGSYEPSRSKGTTGTTDGPCADSSATTLNGTSGYLSTSNKIDNPNNFTTGIWFKTTTTRGGALLGFSDTMTGPPKVAYDRTLYLTDAGTLIFAVYPNKVETVTSTKNVNDGRWHQATVSLSGAGMRLYIDGALADSKSTVTTGRNYSGYLRIGQNYLQGWPSRPTSEYLNASISDAASYSPALSAAQIADQYAAAGRP